MRASSCKMQINDTIKANPALIFFFHFLMIQPSCTWSRKINIPKNVTSPYTNTGMKVYPNTGMKVRVIPRTKKLI